MTALPPDQDQRHQAVRPDFSVHLEAPAGSGKTSVLLERYLALLGRVEAPEDILVLTFTRKAAGELRTRIMQLFAGREEETGGTSPHEVRQRELVQQVFARHVDSFGTGLLDRLQIMTFHSFCAKILKLAPHEAGVPLEFRLLDELEAQWRSHEAVEETRRRLTVRRQDDPVRQALVRRLVRLNNNWSRLARELADLLARRDSLRDFLEIAKLAASPQQYRELLTARLTGLITGTLGSLKEAMEGTDLGARWPSFWEALQGIGADLADKLPRQLPGAKADDLPAWRQVAQALLTQSGTPRKTLDSRAGYPKDFGKTPFAAMIRDLPETATQFLKQVQNLHLTPVSAAEVTALQDLVLLLGEVITVYRELMDGLRALDFAALEQAGLDLLETEDPRALLLRLDLRLKHLLVDEVQDTSHNQVALLCRLMTGWQGDPHRTFMVVGDPKQSIYGWRQARLRLFLEMRRGLRCASGFTLIPEPLLLSTNFRTTRTLIDWVNQVFGNTVMREPAAMEGVAFHPAAPAPAAAAGDSPRLALFPTTDGDRDAARRAEARWLAGELNQALIDLPAGEKIGVLLFSRTHLTTYLEALREAGVLAQVKEGLRLEKCPAAAHLHNVARALAHAADDVAWAAILRASWTAASLEVLSQVAGHPGALWPEKLQSYAAAAEGPTSVAALASALAMAQQQVGRLPLADILAVFLEQVGGWEAIAGAVGPGGVANARFYLDLLAQADAGLPELTWQQADFAFREAFQAPDPRAQESPVEILTVHGAKGLEFHTVFLPYLDWQPLRNASQVPPFLLEEIPGSDSYGLALSPPFWDQSRGTNYRLLKGLRDRRLMAEARRVFYVAATRAKARLVLSAIIPAGKKGAGPATPHHSPLGWVWQHYHDPDLGQLGPGIWKEPDLAVEMGTEPPPLNPLPARPKSGLAPLIFKRQPAPYRLVFPSQLTPGPLHEGERRAPDETAPDSWARARGEVIHALMESLSRGEPLPEAGGVAAALRRAGLSEDYARAAAPQILAEVRTSQNDPFLREILKSTWPTAISEWLLEDSFPGEVRRGIIDRLVFNGREWWLVDYKTSRPPAGQGWDDFLVREKEHYRPQLLAYREMAARVLGLADPAEIRLLLYFTACQQAVML